MPAGIELPWSIEPAGQEPMLVELIKGASGFAGWIQADADYATFAGGKVLSLGGPSAMAVMQPIAANQAALVDNAAPGGYSALAFSPVATTRYPLSTGVLDTTKPFSLLVMIKPALPGAATQICLGRFSSSTVRAALSTPANAVAKMNFLYGAATIEFPIAFGQWNAVWIVWDGAKLKARSNGVRAADVTAAADTATSPFVIGGPASGVLFWEGQFAEMIAFSSDMFALSNQEGFDDVNTYLANVYGLTA